jgi:hypothetical protein
MPFIDVYLFMSTSGCAASDNGHYERNGDLHTHIRAKQQSRHLYLIVYRIPSFSVAYIVQDSAGQYSKVKYHIVASH